jgi:hypothetical protein
VASAEAGAAVQRLIAALVAVAVGLSAAVAIDARADQPIPQGWRVDKVLLPSIADSSGGLLDGVMITRMSNVVVDDSAPFPFDRQVAGWEQADPSVIVVPADGWYMVGADITTLGTAYGGPSNRQTQLSVVKDWEPGTPPLLATVAFENFHADDGQGAHGNSLLQPVWLEAGDRLELVIGSQVLVESNPSDGLPGDFLTDEGPGVLSPRFYLLPL